MKPIDRFICTEFSWIQPRAMRAAYRLMANGEAIATLLFQKPLGSLALAEAVDGRWSFKRAGFLRPRVTVRVAGSESDIATLEPGWTGRGVLQFTDGRRYRWLNASFWGSEWDFATDDGQILIRFQLKIALRKKSMVTVEPLDRGLENLSLLLLLGWYLIVLMARDAAATVASVAAVTPAG